MGKVVCVGCGIMGSKLIRAFMEQNHTVAVVNRTFEKTKPFLDRGAAYYPTLLPALKEFDPDVTIINVDSYDTGTNIINGAAEQIRGRIFVNVSTGTPEKTTEFNALIQSLGGKFVAGVLTCYPRNIGAHRDGSVVYAGNADAYKHIKRILDALSPINIYIGKDVRYASTFDTGWLAAHYGLYWGLIQAAGICKANGVSVELYAGAIKGMINALVNLITPNLVSMIGTGNFGPAVDASIHIQALSLREMISSCEENGIDASVFRAICGLCDKAIEAGDGDKNIEAIVKQIIM